MDIHGRVTSSGWLEEAVRQVRRLLAAEVALLAVAAGPGPELQLYECRADDQVLQRSTTNSTEILAGLLKLGTPLVRNEPSSLQLDCGVAIEVRNLCGVPLSFAGQNIGALLVVNRMGGGPFTRRSQDFLSLLGCHLAAILANTRLSKQNEARLEENLAQLSKLNHVLSAQHAALQKSMTIHNLLTNMVLEGHGLDDITRSIGEIIDNSVIVTDHFLTPLSAYLKKSDGFDLRDVWDGAVADAGRKEEILSLFQGKRLIRLNGAESEENDDKLVVLPVVAGQDHMGFVATLERKHKLSEMDYIALEHACTVVALDFLKQKAAFETELRLRKNFLKELMQGSYESEEGIIWKARQMGLDFSQVHRVVVLEIRSAATPGAGAAGGCPAGRSLLQLVDRVLKAANLAALLAEYNNDLIMLIPDPGAQRSKVNSRSLAVFRNLADRLSVHLTQERWWLGIGAPCSRVTDFVRSYREARACVEIARSVGRRNCSFAYEQLGVFSLLDINREAFREFAGRVIGPLLAYEEKHGSRLLSTLDLYYQNNCNILKAARKGFLSPGTVRYRLRKIREIAQIDLDDPDTNLKVQLALKLINTIRIGQPGE